MFPDAPRQLTIDAALIDLQHSDPRVRSVAADALGSAPEDRADEARRALRGVLDDGRPDVRYAAALSVGELRDAEAVERLVRMLNDRDIMPRQAAAISLGKIGDKRAVEPLIAALADGPPDVRFQATASLVELDGVRAVEPLTRALEDHDSEVRGSAAAGLGDLEAHGAADAIAPLLLDNIEAVRVEAAYALGRLGDKRGLEPLCQLTTHRDFGFMVCEQLGLLGDADAIPYLRKAWKRFFLHPLTRVRAAASMVRLGDPEPQDYLLRMCRSWRSDVRGLTLEMLGEVGGEWALQPLLDGLRGRSMDAAARALGHLGNPRAITALQEALTVAEGRGDEDLVCDLREAAERLERLR